jgi:hypothetical protein
MLARSEPSPLLDRPDQAEATSTRTAMRIWLALYWPALAIGGGFLLTVAWAFALAWLFVYAISR